MSDRNCVECKYCCVIMSRRKLFKGSSFKCLYSVFKITPDEKELLKHDNCKYFKSEFERGV